RSIFADIRIISSIFSVMILDFSEYILAIVLDSEIRLLGYFIFSTPESALSSPMCLFVWPEAEFESKT
ncbi:hypothetical protein L9F63_020772, partial [Diploptera punctata]